MLHAYIPDPDRSFQFLREIQTTYKIQPDAETFTSLVDSLSRAGQLSRVCGLVEGLVETAGSVPNETLFAAVNACLQRGELDWGFRVVALLRLKGLRMNQSMYHSLIDASFTAKRGLVVGGWKIRFGRAWTVLGWMVQDECPPTVETYERLLGARLTLSF